MSIGLCAAYRRRGLSVSTFKKGPDYIDPLWLARASARPCWNLDFFTMGENEIRSCFQAHQHDADIVLVDDVLTSGATSAACVKALKSAGAKSVMIACFSRVLDETIRN